MPTPSAHALPIHPQPLAPDGVLSASWSLHSKPGLLHSASPPPPDPWVPPEEQDWLLSHCAHCRLRSPRGRRPPPGSLCPSPHPLLRVPLTVASVLVSQRCFSWRSFLLSWEVPMDHPLPVPLPPTMLLSSGSPWGGQLPIHHPQPLPPTSLAKPTGPCPFPQG